jgi:hypothetical protein
VRGEILFIELVGITKEGSTCERNASDPGAPREHDIPTSGIQCNDRK